MKKKICKHLIFCLSLISLILTGCSDKPIPYDTAEARLLKLTDKVSWQENYATKMAMIEEGSPADLASTLPPIDNFKLTVDSRVSAGDAGAEIFSSTEKSGAGTDGWLVQVAEDFNKKRIRLSSGKTAEIRVRQIASGTGCEFIISRKYVPDAFSPSNHLWIKMVQASGIRVEAITERMVGNVAGIVMKNSIHSLLEKEYGTVTVENIIDAVIQGTIAMGYTNPFASSTGLNLLQTVLVTAARGDQKKMLEPAAVDTFEAFQRGVPFVALTTLQMRESVEKDRSLGAFVMEYQTFANTQGLKSGYRFIPFGSRHDNPLYALGDINSEKRETLERFADFASQPSAQKLADRYGFNKLSEYRPPFDHADGEVLLQAQKLWKEKKDSGFPVLAVFLGDVSGSMRGLRIKMLREALIEGCNFISPENYIGLAVFERTVSKILPVRKFDIRHKSMFISAVESLQATGSATAMYDGITVALEMLLEAKRQIPDGKPILFVLTDGETNSGFEFSQVRKVFEGLLIPIYTISYGESIGELRQVSSLNEAASLKADETDIKYQIGALLNAEM